MNETVFVDDKEERWEANKEWIAIAEEQGYEVDHPSCKLGSLWVKASGCLRCIDFTEKPSERKIFGEAPAYHSTNFVGDRFRYNNYGRTAQNKEPEYITDYADDKARMTWPDYVVDPKTGREGPKPFKSTAQRKEYEKRYGLRHLEPGEDKDDYRVQRRRKKNDKKNRSGSGTVLNPGSIQNDGTLK